MARSFSGAASDRVLLIGAQSQTTAMTWCFLANQHGSGGGAAGRVWLASDVNGVQSTIVNVETGPTLFLNVAWTTVGQWSIPRPTLDVWHAHVVTYDGSSTVNNAAWVVDGVSQTVTRATAPTGSLNVQTKTHYLGNRTDSAQDRNWDGMLAEFGLYNRIWTSGEIDMFMAGYTPEHIPRGLLSYVSLVGAPRDLVRGAVTTTGGSIQPHPRVVLPRYRRTRLASSAAPPPPPTASPLLTILRSPQDARV